MLRTLSDIQQSFSLALADPGLPIPANVLGRQGKPDIRRFSVYRNNVMVGLTDALRARFPVTERLVGEEFFRAIAHVFVTSHKPRSPLLMIYGDEFPAFIEYFEPASKLPYMPDVARLEVAWSQAYHAAEAIPLNARAFASCRPDDLIEARLSLHPSVRLIRSAYPIAAIWTAHQGDGEVNGPEHWEGEDVLVLRPDAEVLIHCLPAGGYDFAAALLAGKALGVAAEAGLEAAGDFDIARNLTGLVSAGAVIALYADQPETTP